MAHVLLQTMRRRPQPIEYKNVQKESVLVPRGTSGIYLDGCIECRVRCEERVTQITMTSSKNINLQVTAVVSSVDIHRSSEIRIQVERSCPTIVLDDCTDVTLIVPLQPGARIVSLNCTGLIVRGDETTPEYAIPTGPRQTSTFWNGTTFVSQTIDRSEGLL